MKKQKIYDLQFLPMSIDNSLTYWIALLKEVRYLQQKDKQEIAKIILHCEKCIRSENCVSLRRLAANVLYIIDPVHEFGVIEFCDSDILAGKLQAIRHSDENVPMIRHLFMVLLTQTDSLDATCILRLLEFLQQSTRIKTIAKQFTQSELHEILHIIIVYWHIRMNDNRVTNSISKAIGNGLIDLMGHCSYDITKVLYQFVLDLPYYIKFKYAFLQRLLMNAKVGVELLIICYQQLEICLSIQSLASISSSLVIVILNKLLEIDEQNKCIELLQNTLVSSNRNRFIHACRLWLPKLKGNVWKPVLNILMEKFRRIIESEEHSNRWPVDRSFADWQLVERITFAWISIIKNVINAGRTRRKDLAPNVEQITRLCLCSRQKAIKLQALEIAHTLNLCEDLVKFIQNNANDEDFDIRTAVLTTFRTFDLKIKLKCLAKLWNTINDNDTKCYVNCRLMFIKALKDLELFNAFFDSADAVFTTRLEAFLIAALIDANEQTIRQAALDLFNFAELDALRFFQKKQFVDVLRNHVWKNYFNVSIIPIAKLLLKHGVNIFTEFVNWMKENESSFIPTFTTYPPIIVIEAKWRLSESLKNFENFCVEFTHEWLKVGGSDFVGECLNVAQLNSHFAMSVDAAESSTQLNNYDGKFSSNSDAFDDDNSEDEEDDLNSSGLIWSSKQRHRMMAYSNGLIEMACVIRSHMAEISSNQLAYVFIPLVCEILLRTHHKGVLQKCADHFDALVQYAAKTKTVYAKSVNSLLDRTFAILVERKRFGQNTSSCKSRDIAFAEIFHSVCRHFPNETPFVVKRLLDEFENCALDEMKNEHNLNIAGVQDFSAFEIRMRILFVLRRFLQSSILDVRCMHRKICALLLRQLCQSSTVVDSGDVWKTFSMICSAFVAFTEAIFCGCLTRVPLASMLSTHGDIFGDIAAEIVQISERISTKKNGQFIFTKFLKALPVLLAPFERVIQAGFPFESVRAKKISTLLIKHLQRLLFIHSSWIVRQQISDVIVNLVPYRHHDQLAICMWNVFENCKSKQRKNILLNCLSKSIISHKLSFNESSSSKTSYYSVFASRKMQGSHESDVAPMELLKRAVAQARSKNVTKRIEAAECFIRFFAHNFNVSENSSFWTNILSDWRVIRELFSDELDEVRLVACLSSIFFPKTHSQPNNILANAIYFNFSLPLDVNTCVQRLDALTQNT